MTDGESNQPVTPADPEAAMKMMLKLIHGPAAEAAGVPTNKFILACTALQKASAAAAAQGHNAAAAETMAIINREIRIRLRFVLPKDEADALRKLQDSATAAEGDFLAPGIQETIAALSISDEELAKLRAANPNYNETDTERRLLAILDEYFYHTLKKETLLPDWPAKLEEISSFDPDLAARAASQFFNEPQASLTTFEEFNGVTAAAEQACAAAGAKGYFANAARTMAGILLQIRENIPELTRLGQEEMASALRSVGDDALGKFNTIMEAWATVAFRHPEDPRSAEQILTAETTLMNFVQSLSAAGITMPGNPPPAPTAS